MTYISLFSGIGGLDLAVESVLGEKAEIYVENNKFARQVLETKLGGTILEDVRDIEFTEFRGVDGIVGGWPCQPHSLAGKRLGSNDDRDMWKYFVRAIRDVKPKWILGENVKGVLSSEKGEYFGRVLRDLAEAGYAAAWRTILASDVGAPHRRERLFILAVADRGGPFTNGEIERGGLESETGTSAQQESLFAEWEAQDLGDAADNGSLSVASNPQDPFRGFGVGSLAEGKRLGWRRSPGESSFDWRQYEPSISRWESIVGPHPYPVDEKNRLTPNFIEWFMGFPKDWTEGLSRNQAMKGLGNAVVPLQGAVALDDLISRIFALKL